MAEGEASERVILQLRAVLRGISPLIWRRLLVPSDTSIAQLHYVLQVAVGWEDMYLHRFEIRGREYGLSRESGMFFDADAGKVRISDLKLRRMERFTYEYDFGDSWVHDIRIEATLSSGHWTFSAIGRNLTNSNYLTTVLPNSGGFGAVYGMPPNYLVEITYKH
jgi:outer membrane receptor protein involved in Fe transport